MRVAGTRRSRWATVALILSLLGAAAPVSASADEPLPPQGSSPPGANDFSCRPPARHPYPVVLVHGTFGNMSVSWGSIVPPLNAWATASSRWTTATARCRASTPPATSRPRRVMLQTFVQQVLGATGASNVSIIGHSQGGMMPRYLIKSLGGAGKVDDLVGLSPSNHGTTTPLAGPGGMFGCQACAQQVAGSSFMNHLNAGDQTPPPVTYSVIETKYDEVVTPYESEFLPGPPGRVTNVLLQDRYPGDTTEHVQIIFDPVAIQWALNALGRPGPADPSFRPDCSGQALATFPDSWSVTPRTAGPGSGGRARASIVLGPLSRRSSSVTTRRFRVLVRGGGLPVHGVSITIRRAKRGAAAIGSSRRFTLVGRRYVLVSLRRRFPAKGLYVATAVGRSEAGRVVRARRVFRLF